MCDLSNVLGHLSPSLFASIVNSSGVYAKKVKIITSDVNFCTQCDWFINYQINFTHFVFQLDLASLMVLP